MSNPFLSTPPQHHGIAEQEARLDLLSNVLKESMADAKAIRERSDRVIARLEELHQEFIADDKTTYPHPGRHSKDAPPEE